MGMQHPKAMEWESKLKEVFDRIDLKLEEKYGKDYPLHPARQPSGTTANPEYDGLFNVGAAFSAGFGSAHGHGYVVDIRMATLARVPEEVIKRIREEVVEELKRELPRAFPGRDLRVERDGSVFKIVGDLGLGAV